MNWTASEHNAATDRQYQALKRIVALLLSLAKTADRAAGSSRPVCLLVLSLLRPAEAVARAFVIDLAHDLGAPTAIRRDASPIQLAGQDSNADATRLAGSFYALALLLEYMLAAGGWRARPHGRRRNPARGIPLSLTQLVLQPIRRLDVPDTS